MGLIGTVVVVVALVVAWGIWNSSRSKVAARTRIHFTQLVDALEEGDIERVDVCKRVFNEISGNALNRFSLEQLVKRMYVNEQDVLRIHALNKLQSE